MSKFDDFILHGKRYDFDFGATVKYPIGYVEPPLVEVGVQERKWKRLIVHDHSMPEYIPVATPSEFYARSETKLARSDW